MMSLIFMVLLLFPLCFFNYWLFQYFMFLYCFLLIMNNSVSSVFMNVSLFYGYDNFSYYFLLLSSWICSLMILASSKILKSNNYYKIFNIMVLMLLFSLNIVFSSLNLFIFYIFFEISLIPLMILIIGWGYQPERLMAGMYLIFYTIFFSLPMMVGLFIIYNYYYSFMFFEFSFINQFFLYFLINMVFFVKIPLYFIHLWLPKAHVEAPVSGSMILAGIMLKLGGYGLVRLMKMFYIVGLGFNMFFIVISLVGGFYISLICFFQTDIKSLIAYSSVSHMGLVLSSILTLTSMGFIGSFVMMLAHGLCSSGLFCMANIYYERFNSRSLYLIKGLINIFPNFSLMMFLLSVNNMAAPPSLNLLGELLMMKSIISYEFMSMIFLGLMSFFCSVYSIYLYSFSNHGKLSSNFHSIYYGISREYLLVMLHLLPLNFLIIYSDSFMF